MSGFACGLTPTYDQVVEGAASGFAFGLTSTYATVHS
jgi:hypothetical protein